MHDPDDLSCPKIWKGIKFKPIDHEEHLKDAWFTQEEFRRIIEVVDYQRDKALYACIIEGALRVGEALGLRIRDCKPTRYGSTPGYDVTVSGKTGTSSFPMVMLAPLLTQWLNVHPQKHNPEAYLWIAKQNNPAWGERYRPLKQGAINYSFKRYCKEAGITRNVHIHMLRHSKITWSAANTEVGLSDEMAKKCFRWKKSSRMYSRYVHMGGLDSKKALLALQGIRQESEKTLQVLSQVKCLGCGELNAVGVLYCPKCVTCDTVIAGIDDFIPNVKKKHTLESYIGQCTVLNTYRRLHMGKITCIKGAGLIPIHITPDHPILTVEGHRKRVGNGCKNSVIKLSEPYWCEAQNLIPKHSVNRGNYLVIPKPKGFLSDRNIDLSKYHNRKGPKSIQVFPLNSETSWLIGLYIAEGCYSPNGPKFCLGKHEKYLADKVSSIISSLGFSPAIRQEKTALLVELPSRVLARALDDWCGHKAPNKKVPYFIMNHKDDTIINACLEGYYAGDGTRKPIFPERLSMVTTSKILALQLQRLYSRFDRFLTIVIRKHNGEVILGRNVNAKISYRLSEYGLGTARCVRFSDKYMFVPVRKVEIIDFSGLVYNLQTSDETYTANNITVHNCGLVLDAEQAKRIVAEKDMMDKLMRKFMEEQTRGG